MKITKPGIYRDFDGEAYFADPTPEPSLTQSIAQIIIDQSALHAKYEHPRFVPPDLDDEEDAEKYVKAQAIGNAAHKLMLGRGKDIAVLDFDDFKKRVAKDAKEDALASGQTVILKKHMTRAEAMVQSARTQLESHDDNNAFTNGAGEVMICWQEDGLWMRSLIDWLHDDLRTVDDLKTTGMSVAPHLLGQRAESAGWEIQAAMIERGLNVLDPDGAGRRRFRFIAQENSRPFALSVMHMDETWLTFGRQKLDQAIMIWRDAMKSDRWAGYPNRGIVPEYPGYAGDRWIKRAEQFVDNNEHLLREQPRGKMLTDLSGA